MTHDNRQSTDRHGRGGAHPSLLDDPYALSDENRFAARTLSGRPRLLVVVDAEETFDWSAPFDRNQTDTSAMSEVGFGQDLCEAAGLAPTYVVDYPVATDAAAMDRLASYSKRGSATIGAQLHSWVCPPFEEEVNAANSYQGNLPLDLERRKLAELSRQIEEATGKAPKVHKAGRYGFGWGTAEILVELGYKVDLSPMPGFDQTVDGGPNHERVPNAPQWLNEDRSLLSIASTGNFVGLLEHVGPWLYRISGHDWGRRFKTGGIISRLGLLERIRLSPEGSNLQEMKRLTHSLLNQGEKVFALTYHSPSLAVGCTPYVRDKEDLRVFLDTIERYLAFFLEEIGGQAATPLGLFDEIRSIEDK